MTNWTKHTGTERPSELAPAQIVEVWSSEYGLDRFSADSVVWQFIEAYRPALDPDGLPYVSAEGLEDWAEYVATDEDGGTTQFEVGPELFLESVWDTPPEKSLSNSAPTPSTHAIPGPPENSLARVWRE